MGKHHFTIKHNKKSHKCYLDEDSRVYVLDDKGTTMAISAPTGITKIEDAKEAAKVLIESLESKEK